MKVQKDMAITTAILVFCLTAYAWAFHFLQVSDKPVKSDAIVLFVGPDYDKRLKEAHQLMHEGYADTLIVPAYKLMLKMEQGDIVRDFNPAQFSFNRKAYPEFYENTHVEALEARKLMEEQGITSAIMVSEPLHMRRIKIISSRVFDKKRYRIKCIGSRYLRSQGFFSTFRPQNVKFTLFEAVKICSFWVYQLA
ncbi:YdcF family protein [Desulfobacter curvatus]|uniref:YdcF family protein n=1 Tax=Desulfobacter curvatus TaxID=2290 RepID=UPI0012F78424|nr:ElyC/SanA/YdcF family protein [Desulfobacter curvatus]